MKLSTLLAAFIILCQFTYSQNTTSRLRIESGGSIFFNFNSMDKYKNGISYINWTKVSVYFIDTTALGASSGAMWVLDAKANSAVITGDGGHWLPLNTIELEASGLEPLPTIYNGPVALTILDNQHLVESGPQTAPGKSNVNITYHCGKSLTVPNNLLGKQPDYYYIDIILTLKPQ